MKSVRLLIVILLCSLITAVNCQGQLVTEHLKPLAGEKIYIAMHLCDVRLKGKGWGGMFAFPGNSTRSCWFPCTC
jgi:hypothetical protein